MPEGLLGKLKMLPKLAELGVVLSEDRVERPVQGSHPHRRQFSLLRLSRSCTAGRRTAAASSRCRWCSRAIPTPASATAAATACRCSTSAPPACTGRRTSRAPSTIAACSTHGRGKRMDVAVAIGADPATMYSAILPLPPDLDEMMIAGFLRGKPVEMVKCETCDLEVPAQRRDRARRLRRAGRAAHAKVPSAITPASIRSTTITRCSTSPASRIARIRFTRPPSSARRRWRISTWARPSSASFCR